MKKILLLGLVFLLAGCHSAGDYQVAITTPVSLSESIDFVVPMGSSVRKIAGMLAEQGIISADWAFEKYVAEQGLALQAGEFRIKDGMTIPQIAESMQSGQASQVKVTIPEGYRLAQIDTLFADTGLISAGDLLAEKRESFELDLLTSKPGAVDLEGYLYPDTYFFEKGKMTAKEIMEKMVITMDQRLDSKMRAEIKRQGKTVHEILTMASLIERESRAGEERRIVSGILWKRIAEGISLGVDATIQYSVRNDWKTVLTAEDLAADNPYNTRKNLGLPPGPICSPSLESIEAAIYPEQSEWYYYLHDSDGVIHYARTNTEHNVNRERYL